MEGRTEAAMRTLIGSLLGIIALGVLLIAYGLLGPRAGAATTPIDAYQSARTLTVGGRVALPDAYPAGVSGRTTVGSRGVTAPVRARSAGGDQKRRQRDRGRVRRRPVSRRRLRDDARGVDLSGQRRPGIPAGGAHESRWQHEPRVRTAYVERRPGRDWKKTAMVIGGSGAAGAGLGAIFGGKKGALIGAAIGGGAGTLFEVSKR